MAANIRHSFVCFVFVLAIAVQIPTSSGQLRTDLTTDYYAKSCPGASKTVKAIVEKATLFDPRMGASLLRLHFHDCFVNGCDGSVLLVDTPTFTGEQTAIPNNNSLRGFDVVAKINNALNEECGCVVSCADILAMAARDSVASLGGPRYKVLLGRNDSKTASFNAVLQNLPAPFFNFTTLVANFESHFLNLNDLVALSGAHTLGFARCISFMQRIYNDTDINATFKEELQQVCPNNPNSVNANGLWPLDNTTTRFDTKYYQMLTQQTGLLHSDQELFSGGSTSSTSAQMVTDFSNDQNAFFEAFKVSILKMGNLPPTNNNTEIRCNCSIPNSPSPPSPAPAPPPSSLNSGGISVTISLPNPGISVSVNP